MLRPISILPIVLLASLMTSLLGAIPRAGATVTTIPLPQLWQHKDGECRACVVVDPPWCPTPPIPHPELHALEGCPHCAAYCAPASIMMMRRYRGYPYCPGSQDCVYERNKWTDGETRNNGVIESHGVGMYDQEVYEGFLDALYQIHLFNNGPIGPAAYPISPWDLRQLICMDRPVLWIDRDGYPPDMPPQVIQNMMERGEGHTKVLAGYDDQGTYCFVEDDLVQVYDPWPSSGSPYWAPVPQVLYSDPRDIFASDGIGGVDVAESLSLDATAWSNGRHLVRDESDGSYGVLYASNGHVYFSKSTHPHDPRSWSAPVLVDWEDVVHWSKDPALAVSPNPHGYSALHAVWVESALEIGAPGDPVYSESLDGGRTWSAPEVVYSSPLEDSRHPSLDVDGYGGIHLVWDETGLEGGREILYSTRPAQGDLWTAPENISQTPYFDSSFPTLATSYDGIEFGDPPAPAQTIHVAWQETYAGPAFSTIVYRYWSPAIGWFPPLLVPPEDVAGGLGGTSPSIIGGPDRVPKVVWTTSQEPPEVVPSSISSVYFNERQGGAWLTPQMVSPPDGPSGTASICPTIAFANGPFCSCLQVSWEEWNLPDGGGDVWVALRSGMTMTWTAHTRVTYEPHSWRRFPALAYKNGTDFTKGYDLAWTDTNYHYEWPVRFLGTSAVNPGASSAGERTPAAENIDFRAWPNPFRDRIEFSGPVRARDRAVRIFDVSGRRVRELATESASARWIWDGRDEDGRPLPQGVYLVRLQDTAIPPRRILLLR